MAHEETKTPPRSLPLLPLRDIIVFPHMVSKLFVGRERSIAALDEAMAHDKAIFLAAQKSARTNDPTSDDIFAIGTVGVVMQLLRLPDGTVQVLVEGRRRGRVRAFEQTEPFFKVELEEVVEPAARGVEIEALMRSLVATFDAYVKLNKRVQPEVLLAAQAIEEPGRLADAVIAHLSTVKLADRQALLETADPKGRLERLFELLQAEIEILQVERKIRSRVKKQMDRTQKEYYLNEQMQAIQKELGGERDELRSELQEVEEKLRAKRLSKEALGKVRKELKKLKLMHPTSAEAAVVRNYVDWVVSLPWGEKTEERYDLEEAERVLDEEHYGLKRVKERVVEYLAVQALTRRLRGPVLCFVGPPGVGKTSLAKSVARATGRTFVRLSLGGLRDEAEIRGHRRTYIGALPGKIVQSLKKAGANNPVFLLDEVDKMSTDFRGDPASALLEVLDPEQNAAFNDHYLDLDYDLSDVMFITTANSLSGIPLPLQDRMEVIQLSGYTEFEKLNIALRHLLPKLRHECGLEGAGATIGEGAIRAIIHYYTQESGVRALERELASVCRKLARKLVREGPGAPPFEVTPAEVPHYLGAPKHRFGRAEERDEIGLTNGLSVTAYGGEMLVAEVAVVPGKGKLIITGKLGDVMQESAQAAMSYVRSRAPVLGLEADFYSKIDLHVHFPEGAIPKDGPSAGITIATSLVSALAKVPVRQAVAMTGEITLRGRVLAIGGLREKLLAAHRAGVATVIVPKENRRDLREVPRRVLKALRLVLVDHMDDVLREALALDAPDAFMPASPAGVVEYRDGELFGGGGPGRPPPAEPSPLGQPGA